MRRCLLLLRHITLLSRRDLVYFCFGAHNTMSDGEEVFYISTPSADLWSTLEKLHSLARREMVTV
jgi:hypothetical protein